MIGTMAIIIGCKIVIIRRAIVNQCVVFLWRIIRGGKWDQASGMEYAVPQESMPVTDVGFEPASVCRSVCVCVREL